MQIYCWRKACGVGREVCSEMHFPDMTEQEEKREPEVPLLRSTVSKSAFCRAMN